MSQSAPKKVSQFFNTYPKLIYKKGQILIGKSDRNPIHIYFLEKGYVGQVKRLENKRKIILNIFKPGSFFPLVLAVGKVHNQYDFESLNTVQVRISPLQDVLAFIEQNKDVYNDFTSRLSHGLTGLLEQIASLISKESQEQIESVMITYAKRFGVKEGKYFKIELMLTHEAIASNLGLSRETVTRKLTKLLANKVIEKKGRFYRVKIH